MEKNMKNKNEKTAIAPNECSFSRWLLTLLIGVVAGLIALVPIQSFLQNRVDTFMGIQYADIFALLSFIPFFLFTALAIKFVAKTPIKDFILGVGGTVNKKLSLIILGLFAGGMLLFHLLIINNITLRDDVQLGQYVFLVVFALLTVWMQTTFEEFLFRGFALRWICKNEIGYSKKSILAAVITSLIFMAAHLPNPEVTSQSGLDIVLLSLSYFVAGFVCFWADLHFGSLLPGMIMHWCNNFILMTLISQKVSAVTNPTLLIDNTPKIASLDLFSTVLIYLPIIVFMVWDLIKRKKAASADKQ